MVHQFAPLLMCHGMDEAQLENKAMIDAEFKLRPKHRSSSVTKASVHMPKIFDLARVEALRNFGSAQTQARQSEGLEEFVLGRLSFSSQNRPPPWVQEIQCYR